MPTIKIPYFRSTIDAHVTEKNLLRVLEAKLHHYKPELSEDELIMDALAHPIESLPLSILSQGKKRITLVTSDHTRPVPSRKTLPFLLAEIRKGNPEAEVTILIATGLHRATTEEEQRRMFGDEIVDRERIIVHDALNHDQLIPIGQLPSGAMFVVNRLAVDCDLLVTEGFIEPHFFAGFSGGRKSILPGLCSDKTVKENHSFRAINHHAVLSGHMAGNPIHEDMVYAARKVNVAFTFNVALDGKKQIIAAFAGDLVESHEKGCDFILGLSKVKGGLADIVITSNGGYPLDQNLYQMAKSAATGEACTEPGGVIILCGSCVDGIGGQHFEESMLAGTPEEIESILSSVEPRETVLETWNTQIFIRALKHRRIILVTDHLDPDLVRRMNLLPATNVDEALELAYKIKGREASVLVIPDGVSTLVVK